MKELQGKKTYIVAILGLFWALLGASMGWIGWDTASQVIITSLGLAGLRAGVVNSK